MTVHSITAIQTQARALLEQGILWPDIAASLLKSGVAPEVMLQALLPMVGLSHGWCWVIIRAAVIDAPASSDFARVREAIEASGIDPLEAIGHMVESGTDHKEASKRLGV
jgi:hypothetical protein